MGRIKIWEEGIQSKEGDILLRLRPCDECNKGGGVYLSAVNKSGETVWGGDILAFHDEPSLEFMGNVDSEIGFKLDEDGKIIPGEPLSELKEELKKLVSS